MQLHHVAFEMLAAFLEVKARQLDLFSFQQIIQLTTKKVKIQSTQRLEVIFSIGIAWCQMSVYKVVVKFYDFRIQTENPVLQGKSF